MGARLLTNVVNAALVNARQAHAGDTNDLHSAALTHHGRSIVPVAFAKVGRRRCGVTAMTVVAPGFTQNA